jgi:hypothetical protein
LVGVVASIQAASAQYSPIRPADTAWISAAYALIIGFVPVVAFGAPIYAAIARGHQLPAVAAVAIGIFPGLLLLLYERNLAQWSIGVGAAVALITHVWFNKSRVP